MTGPVQTTETTYEPHRNLITSVTNRRLARRHEDTKGRIVSSYVYTHDLLGRREAISQGGEAFALLKIGDTKVDVAYNDRSEVVGATYKSANEIGQAFSYDYDGIGNRREAAESRATGQGARVETTKTSYQANALNQYQEISADQRKSGKRFVERLDGFIREEGSDPQIGEVPLTQLFRRGRYWGSQEFSERLQTRLEGMAPRKSRNYRSRLVGPARDHGEGRAREILAEAATHYGMDEATLREDRRGDWRRASVAWAVAKETSVPHAWIAEKLNLKSVANASQQIRRFHGTPAKELPREVKQWKLSRNVA